MEQKSSQNEKGGAKTLQLVETNRGFAEVQKNTDLPIVTQSKSGLKKEDGTITKNEKDSVHLPFKTHFPGFYLTAEGNNILPDIPTSNERGRKETSERDMLGN